MQHRECRREKWIPLSRIEWLQSGWSDLYEDGWPKCKVAQKGDTT